MGLGMGLVMSPMRTAAMNAVDATKAGVASGVLSMSRMVGGTFGVAAMGALISGLGRHKPRRVPAAAAGRDAREARRRPRSRRGDRRGPRGIGGPRRRPGRLPLRLERLAAHRGPRGPPRRDRRLDAHRPQEAGPRPRGRRARAGGRRGRGSARLANTRALRARRGPRPRHAAAGGQEHEGSDRADVQAREPAAERRRPVPHLPPDLRQALPQAGRRHPRVRPLGRDPLAGRQRGPADGHVGAAQHL